MLYIGQKKSLRKSGLLFIQRTFNVLCDDLGLLGDVQIQFQQNLKLALPENELLKIKPCKNSAKTIFIAYKCCYIKVSKLKIT
ncbi:hypothetical protein [Bacillus safensis]|uniref:hypothetical protein n=1 Tax=Bacillus safensis TaxID=561879 RepID=UPI003C17B258